MQFLFKCALVILVMVALLDHATIEYSSASVCVCVCVSVFVFVCVFCACVCVGFSTVTQKEIDLGA